MFAKLKNVKNIFSVNSQNLLNTIFCESTVFCAEDICEYYVSESNAIARLTDKRGH